MSNGRDEQRRAALAAVAPGTPLRDGLERILRGNTGALIVLGFDRSVESICHRRLRARRGVLRHPAARAVQDGRRRRARRTAHRIVRAAVQLVPDPRSPTDETGTRHRTAERVNKQTGYPVVSVSQSMRMIALYADGAALRARGLRRHPVPGQPGAGHAGALQAPAGRGGRHALRAGDRGPGDRPGRRRGGAAAGDGAPDRRRDRRLRRRAGHRRPAARPAARRADRRRRTERELVARDYLPAAPGRGPRTVAERWPSWTR